MRQASVEEMMPLLLVQAPFPVLIGVVYRPPDYSLRPFMQNLPQQILNSGVLRTYYSYHNPVFCILGSNQT
ncbi:hypothetical protein AMECASPLE_021966 [Ameca splendens]|uniref:Uncharacterized protein n=1 Tax=Ameca splendens TaxID=208324 RepID=A0ABV0XGQ0_9TELE